MKKKPGKIRRLDGNRIRDLPNLDTELHDSIKQMAASAQEKKDEPMFAGDSFVRDAFYCNAGAPAAGISFSDDSDCGFFSSSDNEIKISASRSTTAHSISTTDDFNFGSTTVPYTVPNILIQPTDTTSTGTIWLGGGSSTVAIGYDKNAKYAVMNLPRKDSPIAVYVCGRMVTLGILGTDVECAYTNGQVVFEPGAVSAVQFGDRITLSIEYNDEILHYNVGKNGSIEYEGENSSILKVTLVSTIKKDGALLGSRC